MDHCVTVLFDDGIIEHRMSSHDAAMEKYRDLKERYLGDRVMRCPKSDVTDRSVELRVTPRERDAILAALRLFQMAEELPSEIVVMAENGRGHGSFLTDEEIEELMGEIHG